jgi:serine/threonine protein kinase
MGWFETNPPNLGINIAMEYLEHGDLGAYIERNGAMSETDAIKVIFQVLKGVEFMHATGFTHRDLKPEVSVSNPGLPLATDRPERTCLSEVQDQNGISK